MGSVIIHRLPADVAKARRDHNDYMRQLLLSRIYVAKQNTHNSVHAVKPSVNSS